MPFYISIDSLYFQKFSRFSGQPVLTTDKRKAKPYSDLPDARAEYWVLVPLLQNNCLCEPDEVIKVVDDGGIVHISRNLGNPEHQ